MLADLDDRDGAIADHAFHDVQFKAAQLGEPLPGDRNQHLLNLIRLPFHDVIAPLFTVIYSSRVALMASTLMSLIGTRIRTIRKLTGMGRTVWSRELGIDKAQLERTELERSYARDEIIEAVGKHYLQYAYWLVTGLTNPTAGHISTAIEEKRKDSSERGMAG